MSQKIIAVFVVCMAGVSPAVGRAQKQHAAKADQVKSPENFPAVLWQEPSDIFSRDLYYGPGGRGHLPRGPYTFLKEDLDGTNPKFSVRDETGMKWKVKLGVEARPETVASRLVWAVGYFVNEDYFLSDLTARQMPAHLHRGQNLVGPDGSVHNVRLKREPKGEEKTGTWRWREDPFSRTREINGLRVMMAVINNWDLKDENNAVYAEENRFVYMISDLGASFGTTRLTLPHTKAKGNLESYSHSRFITRITPEYIDFQDPARPSFYYLFNPPEFIHRLRLRWIGRRIPREDVRWIGDLLGRLSPHQIEEAFRAAGYTPAEVAGFAAVVERRIDSLREL